MNKARNEKGRRQLGAGVLLLALFVLWTWLVQTVDVQRIGPRGTQVGFAALNSWFHNWTGVNLALYHITDWLGLVPVGVCLCFGCMGLVQWIRRRRLLKVDLDLLLLGGYYVIVVGSYLAFEMFPINYRPILIDGRIEASYPSSTTLLVLSVMPTFVFQVKRRKAVAQRAAYAAVVLFSGLMVTGRLLSGVHWLTDIAGAALLSAGLFCVYRAVVRFVDEEE